MKNVNELLLKLLAETNDNLKNYILQTWEDLNLTYSEVMILAIISEAEKSNTVVHKSQIAKRLGLTKSAITQFCNKLQNKGYIDYYVADSNLKNHYLKLTDDVRKSVESRCEIMDGCLQNFIDNVGEENIVLLMDLMKEFNNAIIRLSSQRYEEDYFRKKEKNKKNFLDFDENDDVF